MVQRSLSEINMKQPPREANLVESVLMAGKKRFADLLPKHITPERFIRSVAVACRRNPKLLTNCSMESIFFAALEAAQCGLDCGGGPLAEGYLIPFGSEAKFMAGYRGLIVLAHRSGAIESIDAEVVYAKDIFEFEKGANPILRHIPSLDPDDENDADIIGAYCIIRLHGGGDQRVFMSRKMIDKARAVSKTAKDEDSIWNKWYPPQCRKTVIKSALKYVPIASEMLVKALEADEADYEPQIHSAQTVPQLGTESVKERLRRGRPPGATNRPKDDTGDSAASAATDGTDGGGNPPDAGNDAAQGGGDQQDGPVTGRSGDNIDHNQNAAISNTIDGEPTADPKDEGGPLHPLATFAQFVSGTVASVKRLAPGTIDEELSSFLHARARAILNGKPLDSLSPTTRKRLWDAAHDGSLK
jgi:recombination protein RecT